MPDMPTVYNSTPSLVFDGEGSDPGRLRRPHGVAVHHLTEMIYVYDYYNHRVFQFTSAQPFYSSIYDWLWDSC